MWALAVVVTAFLTACSENIEPDQPKLDHSQMTRFGSGEVLTPVQTVTTDGSAFNFLNGIKKISMAADGKFSWVQGDEIWVKKDNQWVKAEDMEITSNENVADFYFSGTYDEPTYNIHYTGTSGDPEKVIIASEQVQKAGNNSEHYAASGDAAWGIAKKVGDREYKFNFKNGEFQGGTYEGNHEASYIYFEPRTDIAPKTSYCRIKRIRITEVNNKNICGTYTFNEATERKISDQTRTEDGGNVITVYCGEDVQAVNAGSLSPTEAENNGFTIKETKEPELNRTYLVLQPGTYQLKVEYEVAHYLEQTTAHGSQWEPEYREETEWIEKNIASFTYLPNTYYTMGHKLAWKDPNEIKSYPFQQYYMWGAQQWFWAGATTYPVHDGESQTEGAPSKGSQSWYKDDYQDGSVCIGSHNSSNNWWVNRTHEPNNRIKAKLRTGMRHTQAQGGEWNKALTANQMSFYVVYGDPYYDCKTPWILEEYNGKETVCYGGVWLKKKEKIREDLANMNSGKAEHEKIWWPGDDDSQTSNYSAPFPSDKVRETKTDWSYVESDYLNSSNGQQFNLRYMAPPINYRMPYTNAGHFDECPTPANDGKNIEDYFFVPCLGRFEYDNELTAASGSFTYPYHYWDEDNDKWSTQENTASYSIVEGTGNPTLTLVGSQGYYWTKTPLQYQYSNNYSVNNTTYFHKYVYDFEENLVSAYSKLDKYITDKATYERYIELNNKSDRTSEENAELNNLQSMNFFTVASGNNTPATIIKNVYRYKTYGEDGGFNDNAFYLNIHYNYIALSWQQHSVYVKTGMRIATTDMFQ